MRLQGVAENGGFIFMNTVNRYAAVSVVLLIAVMVAGCAHKGPLLIDFMYQTAQAPAEETARPAIAISPFKDDRGKTESIVGKRFSGLNDQVNDLVVQGTVSDKVTAALKNALKSRGLSARNIAGWDLTEAGIPATGAKLIISGEIKTLWVESMVSFANTKVTAKVNLRIVVADADEKKIIRTINLSSTIENQAVAYSTGLVQNTISEALSTALNQLFNDDELRKRFGQS